MKLLDTNILIFAGKMSYKYLRPLLTDPDCTTSVICKVESLGYHLIKPDEKLFLEGVFTLLPLLPVTDLIIEKAVELRQQKNLKLGDALIAATALIHNCPLYTNNTRDFNDIPNLQIIDPVTP